MLDAGNHQGKFGEDYIRVLTSAAGLIWSKDDIDVDGVDLCIKLPGRTPRGFSPRIEVQVKTVSTLRNRNGLITFDRLDEVQFSKLAGTEYDVPRYLFLVHVPPRTIEYTDLNTTGLLLRHIGYYVSLDDRSPFPAPDRARRVSVRIPMSNILTARSLLTLVTGNTPAPIG